MVIGIGGGAVMDTVKAVARRLGVPFVGIPTIAATCAAWTPLSVWYNDAGQALQLQRLPGIVVPDGERRPCRTGSGDSRDTHERNAQTTRHGFDRIHHRSAANANHHGRLAAGFIHQMGDVTLAAVVNPAARRPW